MAPLVTPQLEAFYDGLCPFCIASMERLRKFDTTHRVAYLDLNDPDKAALAAPRFTPTDLIAEMHVRLPDGTWRIGFAAWAAIIGELPTLRWLGRLLTFPIVADVGRTVYRAFAANRYAVSRVLGLPAPCDPDGACRIPVKA